MKIEILVLLLFYNIGFYAQNTGKIAIDDFDKLELKNNKTFIGKDTLIINQYENGEIHSKGKYALNKSGKITPFKVGYWIHYFRNGKIESEGNFEISSYLDCGIGGLERLCYNYKTGDWKYFDPLGKIEASGKYTILKTHIDTRCEDGDNLIFMSINDDWSFPQGKSKVLDDRISSALVNQEFESFNSLYYSREMEKVIWK